MTAAAQPPAAPAIAVIIPHYNDLRRLEACLTALAPQLAAHPDVDCVVVDNDSPCDLGPVAAAYPNIRFVTEPTKGAAAARNRGVIETRAPGLLFLDSDCVPDPDWLAAGIKLAAGRASENMVVGGRVDTFDETPAPRSGAEAFETVFAFHQKEYVEKKGFSVTANLLTSRAVFDDVGPLIVGLSEDVDWCRRAVAKGHRLIYDDTLRVSHPTRQDWAALCKKWRRTTDEGFQLNGTSVSARVRWLVRAAIVAASGVAHVPKVMGSPKLVGGVEKRRGALTLLKLRFVRAGWMLRQGLSGRTL